MMCLFPAKKADKVNWFAIIGGVVVALAVAAAAACFICKLMKKHREEELLEDDFDDCGFEEPCECSETETASCDAQDAACDNKEKSEDEAI